VKTKISSLIALLCILVYVTAVLYAAFQVYTNVLEQLQTANKELDKVQSLISQSGDGFFTEPFRETIRKTLEDCKVLQGLIITSDPKTELSFENGWGSAIRWDNGPHFITRLGYVTLQPREVSLPGFRNVSVFSMIKAVQYEFMADVLKQTLLVILAALLLSFLTMISSMLRSRDKSADADAKPEKPAVQQQTVYRQTVHQQTIHQQLPSAKLKPPAPPTADDAPAADDNAYETFIAENDLGSDINDDITDDDDMDMSNLPNFDDYDTPVDEAGMADADGDFSLPQFDDSAVSEEQSPAENDFHLDDFVDESSLNLPQVASIDDVDDSGDSDGIGDLDLPDIEDPDIAGTETNDALFDDTDYSLPNDADFGSASDGGISDSGISDGGAFADDASGDDGATAPAGVPSGLYSPRSNVGWEAYTLERLASELHRCAASEQDLVIMLMDCAASVNCDGKLYKKIAEEAIDLFNLKDLTFEYGQRGFTVIIPNERLEEGVNKANEFHDRVFKTCYDSFQNTNDFIIGISSRSGRLVEADKLLHEAARALEKAREEPESPVVAFKSDPEKYREYIRKSF
jgi:hypothetical protein